MSLEGLNKEEPQSGHTVYRRTGCHLALSEQVGLIPSQLIRPELIRALAKMASERSHVLQVLAALAEGVSEPLVRRPLRPAVRGSRALPSTMFGRLIRCHCGQTMTPERSTRRLAGGIRHLPADGHQARYRRRGLRRGHARQETLQ